MSGALLERIAALDDEGFLRRLPALREGFDVHSPAARLRFLGALADRLGRRPDLRLEEAPELLARWAEANRAGDAAVAGPPTPARMISPRGIAGG